ncbi:hypothetical protein PPERSA_12698 [Pseudocohnilembus persalinus]|uniref:Uncharacterized protein n=1 Tax=Pseudocohnilembus persalinus TaxID=266149 RepID=A0A0V0QU34_PSEPJ|nr:hypothetical protein PPERSA_12698 [Pseudocohnilembus persalinus]|eukprot:KRX05520.1 hypothetical protein PPERSA_12698 [Pseudocohnilembus persalinus]
MTKRNKNQNNVKPIQEDIRANQLKKSQIFRASRSGPKFSQDPIYRQNLQESQNSKMKNLNIQSYSDRQKYKDPYNYEFYSKQKSQRLKKLEEKFVTSDLQQLNDRIMKNLDEKYYKSEVETERNALNKKLLKIQENLDNQKEYITSQGKIMNQYLKNNNQKQIENILNFKENQDKLFYDKKTLLQGKQFSEKFAYLSDINDKQLQKTSHDNTNDINFYYQKKQQKLLNYLNKKLSYKNNKYTQNQNQNQNRSNSEQNDANNECSNQQSDQNKIPDSKNSFYTLYPQNSNFNSIFSKNQDIDQNQQLNQNQNQFNFVKNKSLQFKSLSKLNESTHFSTQNYSSRNINDQNVHSNQTDINSNCILNLNTENEEITYRQNNDTLISYQNQYKENNQITDKYMSPSQFNNKICGQISEELLDENKNDDSKQENNFYQIQTENQNQQIKCQNQNLKNKSTNQNSNNQKSHQQSIPSTMMSTLTQFKKNNDWFKEKQSIPNKTLVSLSNNKDYQQNYFKLNELYKSMNIQPFSKEKFFDYSQPNSLKKNQSKILQKMSNKKDNLSYQQQQYIKNQNSNNCQANYQYYNTEFGDQQLNQKK